MANIRMVDARWACLTVERLKAERISTDPILKDAGLTRRQASDPDAKIPFHKHATLLTLAAEATGINRTLFCAMVSMGGLRTCFTPSRVTNSS